MLNGADSSQNSPAATTTLPARIGQSEPTPASEAAPEQEKQEVDLFRRAMESLRPAHLTYPNQTETQAPPASERQPEPAARDAQQSEPVRTSAEGRAAAPAPASTISEEEFNRRVQSEVDRRMDKFQREESKRRKEAEERHLLENDPYAYAELRKQQDAERATMEAKTRELEQFLHAHVHEYDRNVLDPVFLALPKREMDRILSNIGEGIPGRADAMKQAIGTLREISKAEGLALAKKQLMQDQAFIKEVLTRYGGVRDEPDSIPAASAAAPRRPDMNDIIRGAAAAARAGRFG